VYVVGTASEAGITMRQLLVMNCFSGPIAQVVSPPEPITFILKNLLATVSLWMDSVENLIFGLSGSLSS
jgi:hypothetical protein